MAPPEIDVAIEDDGRGWIADITVTEGRSSTRHRVRISRNALILLAPSASAEELARASFEFLLEREPKESILREFDIEVIGRYFHEYPNELSRRLPA
jgi:hypothetical protein